jgi:hypothetical protein
MCVKPKSAIAAKLCCERLGSRSPNRSAISIVSLQLTVLDQLLQANVRASAAST